MPKQLAGRVVAIAMLVLEPMPALSATACSVVSTPISLGIYDVLAPSPTDSSGNIAVTCSLTLAVSAPVSYTILLSTGSSASFASRALTNGANRLSYNIYTTGARTSIWGDGTAGTQTVSDAYTLFTLPVTRNYPVSGRAFNGQNVPPGAYTDTVAVTVNF